MFYQFIIWRWRWNSFCCTGLDIIVIEKLFNSMSTDNVLLQSLEVMTEPPLSVICVLNWNLLPVFDVCCWLSIERCRLRKTGVLIWEFDVLNLLCLAPTTVYSPLVWFFRRVVPILGPAPFLGGRPELPGGTVMQNKNVLI